MIQLNTGGIYESLDYFKSFPTPLRVTDQYELEIYEPCDSVSMMNGVKFTHEGHALFLFPPGTERFSLGPFSCVYLHFTVDDPDLISCLSEIPPSVPLEPDSDLRTRCLEIIRCSTETPEERLTRSARLILFLLSVRQKAKQMSIPSVHFQKYSRNLMDAKKYIDENYGEKITLSDLSKITYLSRNFFRTIFADYFGISPSNYLTKVRISHAIERIRTTDLPLSEIALSCGFGSQSYMSAVLRAQTGRTPAEYR